MKRTLCFILAAIILAGCGARSPKPVDDAAITAATKAKLSAVFGPIEQRQEKQLERGADQQTVSYISVNSVNGVVTLSGEVRGKRAKLRAEEIARSVPQVVRVNNNLSVAPGYSDDAVGPE